MHKSCASCGKPFNPCPQVPGQAFCSAPDCQRARKRQWQQARLRTDPDYRINQRAAQQAWSGRNQDYWRNYRDAKPGSAQRNRERQRARDQRQNSSLAKMDACSLPTGLYRITRLPAYQTGNGEAWIAEITPVCATCPHKMDASREDLIDITKVRP